MYTLIATRYAHAISIGIYNPSGTEIYYTGMPYFMADIAITLLTDRLAIGQATIEDSETFFNVTENQLSAIEGMDDKQIASLARAICNELR